MSGMVGDQGRELSGHEQDLLNLIPQLVAAIRGGWQTVPESVRTTLDESEGLGPRHLKVLAQLALHGPQSVSELSARLGLTIPTTSLMAGELSNASLVERMEDPADRRRTIVSLSRALVPDLDQLVESRIVLVSSVLAGLEPRERDAFLKGMRLLIAEIESLS